MTPKPPESDPRWIAWHLGELSETDRAELQPDAGGEESQRAARVLDEVRQWAQTPVAHRPLEMADLERETAPRRGPEPIEEGGWRRWLGRLAAPGPLAWGVAAAALLVFTLTRVEFSYGDFHWGAGVDERRAARYSEEIAQLRAELEDVTETNDLYYGFIEEVALENSLRDQALQKTLISATGELQRRLDLETEARYADFQGLLILAGVAPGESYRDWMRDASGAMPEIDRNQRGVIPPAFPPEGSIPPRYLPKR